MPARRVQVRPFVEATSRASRPSTMPSGPSGPTPWTPRLTVPKEVVTPVTSRPAQRSPVRLIQAVMCSGWVAPAIASCEPIGAQPPASLSRCRVAVSRTMRSRTTNRSCQWSSHSARSPVGSSNAKSPDRRQSIASLDRQSSTWTAELVLSPGSTPSTRSLPCARSNQAFVAARGSGDRDHVAPSGERQTATAWLPDRRSRRHSMAAKPPPTSSPTIGGDRRAAVAPPGPTAGHRAPCRCLVVRDRLEADPFGIGVPLGAGAGLDDGAGLCAAVATGARAASPTSARTAGGAGTVPRTDPPNTQPLVTAARLGSARVHRVTRGGAFVGPLVSPVHEVTDERRWRAVRWSLGLRGARGDRPSGRWYGEGHGGARWRVVRWSLGLPGARGDRRGRRRAVRWSLGLPGARGDRRGRWRAARWSLGLPGARGDRRAAVAGRSLVGWSPRCTR